VSAQSAGRGQISIKKMDVLGEAGFQVEEMPFNQNGTRILVESFSVLDMDPPS
jgi:hypothetical protein